MFFDACYICAQTTKCSVFGWLFLMCAETAYLQCFLMLVICDNVCQNCIFAVFLNACFLCVLKLHICSVFQCLLYVCPNCIFAVLYVCQNHKILCFLVLVTYVLRPQNCYGHDLVYIFCNSRENKVSVWPFNRILWPWYWVNGVWKTSTKYLDEKILKFLL